MDITITKKDASHIFQASDGERLLYAALRQGLVLPYECATGTCGSCKARLKSGDVTNLWSEAPGAKTLKSDRGEFLMCQSAALSNCEFGFAGKLHFLPNNPYKPHYFTGSIENPTLLTHDVMQFEVALDCEMQFKAGQFVVLDIPNVRGGRAYSMVNYSEQTNKLELIVKRLLGGEFSEWMFNGNRHSAKVEIFGPLGKATLAVDEEKELLCIAGGSGIAGIISLLTQAISHKYFSRQTGRVFFGVRTEEDIFYSDRLQQLVIDSNGNLQVTIALSEGEISGETKSENRNLSFTQGYVTPVAIESIQDGISNHIAFVAGPPPMVDDALRRLVLEAGLPVENVRYDKFG